MRVETVSNAHLPEDKRLVSDELDALPALGWHPPTHSADAPEAERVSSGSVNHHRDFDAPLPLAEIAEWVIHTLIRIHGIHDQVELEYQALEKSGDPLDFTELGLTRRARPAAQAQGDVEMSGGAQDAADATLLRAVRTIGELPNLRMDEDGDIGLVACGHLGYAAPQAGLRFQVDSRQAAA